MQIPPLRDRPEDVLPLTKHILRREVGKDKPLPILDPDTQRILESYPWPGNVRELENAIRHALTFAGSNQITKDVLPAKILDASTRNAVIAPRMSSTEDFRGKSLKSFLRKKEQEYLNQIIQSMGGDKEQAAKVLKISLATLYRKMPQNEE